MRGRPISKAFQGFQKKGAGGSFSKCSSSTPQEQGHTLADVAAAAIAACCMVYLVVRGAWWLLVWGIGL